MDRPRCGLIVAAAVLASTVAGCVSGPVTIPTGRWVGRGCYVDYEFQGNKEQNTVLRTKGKDGRYDTELTIARQELFGHEALVFEIVSRRGRLMNLDGEETRLTLALVELGTLDSGNKLYAVGGCHLGPVSGNPWDEKEFRERLQSARAAGLRAGAETVLEVYYCLPGEQDMVWTDTFVFRGGELLKTGRVATVADKDKDEPRLWQVYWAEELRKVG